MGRSGFWPIPGPERFIAFCELGLRDLDEILLAYPESPEAPEAMYTVGQIEDYPNLNHFEDALETYRKTVSAYPGTDWARLAAERVKVIEEIMGGKSAPE
jgi:outer membrane protein assembly factor BamD (BamD/ComL family)